MKIILKIFFFLGIVSNTLAQDTYEFDLNEIIEIAQAESPEIKLAEIRKSNAYWTYQSFLGNYKPQIDLGVTFPQLTRAVAPVTQPDGTDIFIARSQMSTNVDVALTQNVTATGATVFASTGLQRLDIFKTDVNAGNKSYLSNPITLGFSQPLFGFNALQWDRRIAPLSYEESKYKYSEDIEAVANQAVAIYFDLMVAQLNLKSSLDRKEVADTLYQLGKNRFDVGKIAETELLQLEMDQMRANSDISRNKLNVQTTNERLRDFLGIEEQTNFTLKLPDGVPDVYIDQDIALAYSRQNRSRIKQLQRTLLEAERNREQSKAEAGISGQLTGSVGFTAFGNNLKDAYSELLDQQQVRLGLNIPIADWGKSKANYEIAKSNYELIELNTRLEKVNFEREVIISVQQFTLVQENVALAKLSYETAQKRYDLTRKRYLIGKAEITDLTLAENEQENQRKQYIQAISDFWKAYYNIRSLTLYDFIGQTSLVRD
ncbi:MAG: TolC family protein [Saprospiraceae bacterium]|nr:TolC family protein [Bacteroidia bacterium]NNE13406.1 TolC family protein [Saprospiraceae bacterium]NNL92050.1 TolC family protein [Saprospiraceae bacterium]